MPTVTVNGCEIYYEIHGNGQPLLLIMGLRRNVAWWYRQIPFFAKHFKVIVFDNRGAGRSGKPKMDYSIRLFADDTSELLNKLDIKQAYVLGISMGGYIAQELAINYPEKVKALILGCTGCGGRHAVLMSPERMVKFTANEGLTPEQILRKDLDIFFSEHFVTTHPEEIEEFVINSMQHYQPVDAFQRQFAACLSHDTFDRVGQVDVPVLIASGDDDPLVPVDNSIILNRLVKGAKLELFKGARHCFFMEHYKVFNQLVLTFLQNYRHLV